MTHPFHAALAGLGVGLLSLAAQAATVQVTVVGRDGQPLPDAVVIVEPATGRAAPPRPVQAVISQQKMQFVPALSVVPVGSRVRFVNQDSWEHHLRGTPATLATPGAAPSPGFELRLDGKVDGKEPSAREVTLDKAGAVLLGCHLHGSMRGHVFVADSPWTVKTGGDGIARLLDVPEGAARVRVWHADQLIEAPPADLQVIPATALTLPTAVVPRRRRL